MAKKIEMGVNAQEGLTKMNENGDMNDGIRTQMAKANAVIMDQISEEGMNRESKSTQEIIFEHNKVMRIRSQEQLTGGGTLFG